MTEIPAEYVAHALKRRQVLQYGALGLAALPLWRLIGARTSQGVARRLAAAGEDTTRAGEWSVADTLTAFAADGTYQFVAPYAFGAVGAHWAAGGGDEVHLAVCGSVDGVNWGAWQITHPDSHQPDPGRNPARSDRRFAELIHLTSSTYVRCKVIDGEGRPISAPADLRLVYIDAAPGPALAAPEPLVSALATAPPKVISRAEWGCNEKLRFDAKGQEIWEPEYYVTEKVIVHHTDTPNDTDPIAAIRSVYYYHAVTQGWGDIGYNFLVDRNGNVYEGRYGGENVVAGHALRYNYGSVGIAMLGAFVNTPPPAPTPTPTAGKTVTPTPANTPTPTRTPVAPVPTAAAEAALVQLVGYKARYLDTRNPSFFIDKTLLAVVGHRDVLSTTCPGDNMYPHLPSIRAAVADLVGPPPAVSMAIVGITANEGNVYTNTPVTIRVKVQNTGQGMAPGYFDEGVNYVEGDSYDKRGYAKVPGRFRVVADVVGSATIGTDARNPYRWGLGTSLNPGDTAEAVCRLTFTSSGVKKLRFGLVQEQVAYAQQDIEGPTLNVIGLPTEGVPKPANVGATLAYFAETQHTLGGTILNYWNKFGGLAQFGYPLTEQFVEVSETNNKEYTVQYFERARFELHPEYAGSDYEVLLGQLGRKYHAVDKAAQPIQGQRFFTETGHNLGGLFREYWEQYGGLFIYGLPLTEEFAETSRIDNKPYTVQYFERARFEFHPENTGKSQVLLGHLGRQVLQERGWMK